MDERHLEPHRGTLILVMGILGILVCFVCGILAWVWGSADLKKIKAGTMDPEGQSLTNAGYIMGIISVVLTILGLIFAILVFGAFVTLAPEIEESTGILLLLVGGGA